MKKLIIAVAISAVAIGAGPSLAGAQGKANGKAGQACAEANGFTSLGAIMHEGVQIHGNAAGGVPAGLAAHCAG